MTATNLYANALGHAFHKEIDLTGDTLFMALMDGTYAPDLINDDHWSDVSAHELPTAGGYTAGGLALTTPTAVVTSANAWTHSWAGGAVVPYGAIICPATLNGKLYRCVVAGTEAFVEPVWPVVEGETIVDGTVTWACVGEAAFVFGTDTPLWAAATFDTSFAVIVDRQTGVDATEPLLAVLNFGTPQSPVAEDFEVLPDPILGWFVFAPPG
jgi:hypothetical protein